MNNVKIEITVSHFAGKFFTNASLVTGEPLHDFVCTTGQPTLDMSLASAMSFIRDYAVKLQKFSLAEPAGPEDLRLADNHEHDETDAIMMDTIPEDERE